MCGTLLWFRYGWIAWLTSVPSEPTTAKTLSSWTSFLVSCTELTGL